MAAIVSRSPAVYVKRQRTPLRSLTETLETTKVRYETMNTRSHRRVEDTHRTKRWIAPW